MHVHAMLRHVSDDMRQRRRATYQDVVDAPEHMVAELIDGVLYTSPRPASPHTVAASALGAELFLPFQNARGGPGGWWILDEPEVHFGEDVLVPDIGGWRRARMQDKPSNAFIALPPDWVCEVLSPSTVKLDRTKKLDVYARERVSHVWLVEPVAETLEVLLLNGAQTWEVVARYNGNDRVRAAPFEAIEIELRYLWGDIP